MIKANDLRCGNLVRIKEHLYEGAITYIDAENGIVKTDVLEFYNLLHFEDIEPIELTPERMGKAGFVKDAHVTIGEVLSFDIDGDKPILEIIWGTFRDYTGIIFRGSEFHYEMPEISAVHHLQNWVYLLTGTELSITL